MLVDIKITILNMMQKMGTFPPYSLSSRLVNIDLVFTYWEELGEKLKYVYNKQCRLKLFLNN